MKFTDLDLADELIYGLNDIRFDEPTPVQKQSIPPVLEGRDLIGTAQTGTGKTGAFVIPILQRILKSKREGIKAIILTPTRELAQQIDEQIFAIGYHTGISSATVIGGSDFSTQAKALKAGVDVIVATPGRFMDQHKVVNIDLSNVEYLVLDEADRMLDMGFLPDMKKIIDWLPKKRQTLLFSATMPKEIEKLANTIMTNPFKVEIARSKPAESVEQRAYFLKSHQKISIVKQIFDSVKWDSCIIFTSTKKGTDELQRLLKKQGIKAGSIHGDRSQDERNKALNAFKSGESPVIVATNVIARGIDIKDVSMIINYDVPRSTDDYVHRIGRTGRYDKSGIAITLVTRRDSKTFQDIEKIKGNKMTKIHLPESFNESSEFSWDREKFEEEKGGKRPTKSSGKGKASKRSGAGDHPPERGGQQKSGRDQQKKSSKQSGGRGKSSDGSSKKAPSTSSQNGGADQKSKRTKDTATDSKHDQRTVKSSKPTSKDKDSGSSRQQQDRQRTIVKNLPKVDKAIERNRNARKPAKGVWGIIKSFIPKFRNN